MKIYKLIMSKERSEWYNFYHDIASIYNAICSLKTLGYSLQCIRIVYPAPKEIQLDFFDSLGA